MILEFVLVTQFLLDYFLLTKFSFYVMFQGGSTKYHLSSRWLQVFKSDRDRRDLVSNFNAFKRSKPEMSNCIM